MQEAEGFLDTGDSASIQSQQPAVPTSRKGLPNVEFFFGRDKKGRKTNRIYWMYVEWKDGQRKRVTPTKYLGRIENITRIDHCPHKSRVLDYTRRVSAKNAPSSDASIGPSGLGGRSESGDPNVPDRIEGWLSVYQDPMARVSVGD